MKMLWILWGRPAGPQQGREGGGLLEDWRALVGAVSSTVRDYGGCRFEEKER